MAARFALRPALSDAEAVAGFVHWARNLPPLLAARAAGLRYALVVGKVLRQILVLLWKVARLVLWKWLKPRLMKFAMITAALVGVILLVVAVLGRL